MADIDVTKDGEQVAHGKKPVFIIQRDAQFSCPMYLFDFFNVD